MSEFFTEAETHCKCGRLECDAPPMDMTTMLKADAIRRDFGRPLTVNSGSRCAFRNAEDGGKPDSMHLLGKAIDFHADDTFDLRRLVELACKHGLTFGLISDRAIHVDTRPGRPKAFSYPPEGA